MVPAFLDSKGIKNLLACPSSCGVLNRELPLNAPKLFVPHPTTFMRASTLIFAATVLPLGYIFAGTAIIQPSSATMSVDALGGPFGPSLYAANNVINGSGLSAVPTATNYTSVTHASAASDNAWVTNAPGADWYAVPGAPNPTFVFQLGAVQTVKGVASWGYHFGSGNGNEARAYTLEFSTDGGTTWSAPTATINRGLTAAAVAVNTFAPVSANAVRMVITDNNAGFAAGGDRVGLGEVRFLSQLTNPAAARNTNLVQNPSFEFVTTPGSAFNSATGAVSNWTTDIANSAAGSQAAAPTASAAPINFTAGLDGSRAGHINSGAVQSLIQDIPFSFTTGDTYTLTANVGRRVDHDDLGIGAADWRISIYREDGVELSFLNGSTVVGQGGLLLPQTLSYTATAADAGFDIQVRLTNRNAAGFNAVNFDQVSLVAVPEPSMSLILILTCGMLLARRKIRSVS
jgi:hypothetical protein